MKFAKESLKEIMWGGSVDGLTLIEEGEWIDDGKYSYCEWIFQYEDKFYRICDSRSGSYFTEYYNDSDNWGDEEECSEVKKIEKITHEWVSVDD